MDRPTSSKVSARSASKWLPDWRKSSEYPSSGKDLSPEAWAWEFLRRNPEFQDDYYNHRDDINFRQKYGLLIQIPPDKPYSLSLSPLGGSMFEETITGEYAVCVGLDDDGDPDISIRHAYGGCLTIGNGFVGGKPLKYGQTRKVALSGGRHLSIYGPNISPDEPGIAVAKLDLRLPLPAQIKALEIALTTVQKQLDHEGFIEINNSRTHLDKFPIYIRVLDAEAQGASIQEIASILNPLATNTYPEKGAEKSIRNWLAAAQQISATGYRFIPLPRTAHLSPHN
ncbi:MAG: hypothetical protein KZQ91_01265 [Candidatus Thiodiazotropha sp. (ex Lucinoma borealis)]|nr:hypothetical protein [Candidatus Thiodiazotropha sp. (ex Lucinoma borealis)]